MRVVVRLLRIGEQIGGDDVPPRGSISRRSTSVVATTCCVVAPFAPFALSAAGVVGAAVAGAGVVLLALGTSPVAGLLVADDGATASGAGRCRRGRWRRRVGIVLLPRVPHEVAEEQQRDQEQVARTRHGVRFTRAERRPA